MREVDGVLLSAQEAMRAKGRKAGVLRAVDIHFQDAGMSAADVELARADVHDALGRLGVRPRNKPNSYYAYGLDEVKLETILQTQIRYMHEATRRYDVESLSAVHRLREGSAPLHFERCGYVLVTDNDRLAAASRNVDERHGWPLAMLDSDLAAFLWARSPVVASDLPRQQLLATVYAGIQPTRHLWMKYLDEVEHLQRQGDIREDEAIVLRSRPEARRALMDVTLGDEDTLDDEAAASVVERVRAGLEQPLRDQLEASERQKAHVVANARAREQAEMARAAVVARASEQTTRGLTTQVERVSKEMATLKSQREAQDTAIRQRAERTATMRITWPIYAFAVTCAAFAALHNRDPAWLKGTSIWVGHGAMGATLLVLVLSAVRQFMPGSVVDWLKPAITRLADRLERKFRDQAGLPSPPTKDA